jgi:hypothetical protein
MSTSDGRKRSGGGAETGDFHNRYSHACWWHSVGLPPGKCVVRKVRAAGNTRWQLYSRAGACSAQRPVVPRVVRPGYGLVLGCVGLCPGVCWSVPAGGWVLAGWAAGALAVVTRHPSPVTRHPVRCEERGALAAGSPAGRRSGPAAQCASAARPPSVAPPSEARPRPTATALNVERPAPLAHARSWQLAVGCTRACARRSPRRSPLRPFKQPAPSAAERGARCKWPGRNQVEFCGGGGGEEECLRPRRLSMKMACSSQRVSLDCAAPPPKSARPAGAAHSPDGGALPYPYRLGGPFTRCA